MKKAKVIIWLLLYINVLNAQNINCQDSIFIVKNDTFINCNCFFDFTQRKIDTIYELGSGDSIFSRDLLISLKLNKSTDEVLYTCMTVKDSLLIQKGQFFNGKPTGKFLRRRNLGELYTSNYENGIKQGVETIYYRNGSIRHNNYINGLLQGLSYVTDTLGSIIETCYYHEGSKNSQEIILSPISYKLISKHEYSKGQLVDGDYITYDINGNIEVKGSIKNGQYHGYFYFYNDGKLFYIIRYNLGRLEMKKNINN